MQAVQEVLYAVLIAVVDGDSVDVPQNGLVLVDG